MTEQREKPWWLRLDGMPPTTDLDRAVWRHPARWGIGIGTFQFLAWLCVSRFILNASWFLAVSTALFLGAFWAVTQTVLMKAQAEKAGPVVESGGS